jgi:hypothetical protein
MLKIAVRKAMAVGRFASAVFGLALVIGLTVGVASMALGANGKPFLLGKANVATALTELTGNVNRAAMEVQNDDPGTNDTALSLKVQRGEPPMEVFSGARVDNLNSDKVDGRSFECPGGTLFHEGVCIESTKRGPNDYTGAEAICLGEGRRLPSVAELQTFRNRPGTDFTVAEISNALSITDTSTYMVVVSGTFGNAGFLTWNHELNYRCVVPVS